MSRSGRVTPVALASSSVQRWNLACTSGRVLGVVRTVVASCLRPWVPRVDALHRRLRTCWFAPPDDLAFVERSKARVATYLNSLRLLMHDALAHAEPIADDVADLARDVITQCVRFIERCDALLRYSADSHVASSACPGLRAAVTFDAPADFSQTSRPAVRPARARTPPAGARRVKAPLSGVEARRALPCGDWLSDEERLSPRQRGAIESAIKTVLIRPRLTDEDRLWVVSSLRRLRVDDEASLP